MCNSSHCISLQYTPPSGRSPASHCWTIVHIAYHCSTHRSMPPALGKISRISLLNSLSWPSHSTTTILVCGAHSFISSLTFSTRYKTCNQSMIPLYNVTKTVIINTLRNIFISHCHIEYHISYLPLTIVCISHIIYNVITYPKSLTVQV